MPEGDSLFRAARTLHRALAGKVVVRFETVLAQLSRVDDDAPIAGRTVERVRSVGKHLLVELSADLVLRPHDPSARLWVYGRVGKPCRICGERIVLERRGPPARSSYFCPRCQVLRGR